MGKVYQSVRGVVQGTLHRRNPEIVVSPRPQGDDGSNAMEELEKIVADGIGRLRAAVSNDHAALATKAQHAAEAVQDLKATIAALEAKLRDMEGALDRKDLSGRKMEETLGAEIRDLQTALKKKEEALESRDTEVNGLESRIDTLARHVTELESAIQQTKGEAASEARHAEQAIQTLRDNSAKLEAQLREAEETVRRKDVAGLKTEETLGAAIRDLQSVLKNKEETLESRNAEVGDLKCKIDALGSQVFQLESAIRQANGDAAGERQRAEQVIEGLKAKIAGLELELRNVEDAAHGKEAAGAQTQESLSAEIRELKSALERKEEALAKRDSEVNDLKSTIDILAEQATRFQAGLRQAQAEAASEAGSAKQVVDDLKARITRFEGRVKQGEPIGGGTDRTANRLRDKHLIDLNAEIETHTNGVKETSSSFFSPAGALEQDLGTIAAGEPAQTGEEDLSRSDLPPVDATSVLATGGRETVPQDAFGLIIAEFGRLTNVIISIASLIVRDHARALGESMHEFPQARLTELLESLSREISDDRLKAVFRERFDKT
jgi:chromosome segregation ATPase